MAQLTPFYDKLSTANNRLFALFNGKLSYQKTAEELTLVVAIAPGETIEISDLFELRELWIPYGKADHVDLNSYLVKINGVSMHELVIDMHWLHDNG
jgi:hypothetical protein